MVDLTQGIGPFTPGGYYSTSPAAITRDLVIMGGHVTDNESTNEPSGVIRAYDVDGPLGIGVRRATYLLDAKGKIVDAVLADLRIARHQEFVQRAVAARASRSA